MMEKIGLYRVCKKIARILKQYGRYHMLRFFDERERREAVKLSYFLRNGPSMALVIVGYSGAEGLAPCDYLRRQNSTLPILWLCDRREFEPEASRLGVNFDGTGPPDLQSMIPLILR